MSVVGNSLVYTPDGVRKITEVKHGECVYSFDDYTLAERKCIEVIPRGVRSVFKVILEDGKSVLACGDQLMVKVNDPKQGINWAPRWFDWALLSDLKPGDTIITSKESPETIKQEPLMDEEMAQYIGYRDAGVAEYAVNPFYDETLTELLDIRSIEPAGEAEVYEVAVDLDESFVANGFVLL
jgi:intein/homing endonuclease